MSRIALAAGAGTCSSLDEIGSLGGVSAGQLPSGWIAATAAESTTFRYLGERRSGQHAGGDRGYRGHEQRHDGRLRRHGQ